MNRLLSLTIPEFKKSIENLRQPDIGALFQLIERENQLEQDEYDRLSKIMLRSSLDEFERKRIYRAIVDSEGRLKNLQLMMQVCSDDNSTASIAQPVFVKKSSLKPAPPSQQEAILSESLTEEHFQSNAFEKEEETETFTSLKDCSSSFNSTNSNCKNSGSSFSINSLDNSITSGYNSSSTGNQNVDNDFNAAASSQLSGLTMNKIKEQSIVKEGTVTPPLPQTTTSPPQSQKRAENNIAGISVIDTRRTMHQQKDRKPLDMKRIRQNHLPVHNNGESRVPSSVIACSSNSSDLIEDSSIDARSAIAVFERLSSASQADRQQEAEIRLKLSGKSRAGGYRMMSPRYSSVEAESATRRSLQDDHMKLSQSISDLRMSAPSELEEAQPDNSEKGDIPPDSTELSSRSFFKAPEKSSAPVLENENKIVSDSVSVTTAENVISSSSKSSEYSDNNISGKTSLIFELPTQPQKGRVLILDNAIISDPPNLQNWNPVSLLTELYKLGGVDNLQENTTVVNNTSPTVIEGYLEQLPFQKTTVSSLKTWKKKYFQLRGGHLKVYNKENDSLIEDFNISGGDIEQLDENIIGIDTKRSNYITLRCPDIDNYTKWLEALIANSSERQFINDKTLPDPSTLKLSDKKVLIVDFGSTSVRAGLLRESPCHPELFFPNLAAMDVSRGEVISVGFTAYDPQLRSRCKMICPLRPDGTLDISAFENGVVRAIFEKIFQDLNLDHTAYTLFLSVPPNVSDSVRVLLADLLLKEMKCEALSICGQSLLALHAYGEPTGVLVNVSNRTEILPVTEGIVQVAGISRLMFGGHLILQSFNQMLAEQKYRFTSQTEFLLTRYIMEKCGFVAHERTHEYSPVEKNFDLTEFGVTHSSLKHLSISADFSQCTEGLFDPELFGLDCPSLSKTIQKSVQSCPMDFRKNLYRSIFLAGAASLFPGLPTRLENELRRLVPSSCIVRVHSAPNRKHLSYLGASYVADSTGFARTCVKQSEWLQGGRNRQWALVRWHI